MNMKIAVYTTIIGDYESYFEPLYLDEGIDYHLFTDAPYKSDIWKVHYLGESGMTDRKTARAIKTNPQKYLPDYDLTIWVDGNFKQKESLYPLIEDMQEDYMLMEHPARDCSYEEARVCIKGHLDHKEVIEKQMRQYEYNKFPEHNGLVATGIILRKNTEQNRKFDELWWNEIKCKSERDQLSFNYIAWKTNIPYQTFSFDRIGEFFENKGHKHPRKKY